MKLKISKKDAFLAMQDRRPIINTFEKRVDYVNTGFGRSWDDADKSRFEFIGHCLDFGMKLQEIGDILNISKQRVHYLSKYGSGFRNSIKGEIKERDGKRCRICKRKNVLLHVHHLEESHDNSSENLITLCAPCHRKFEKYKTDVAKRGHL